METQNTSTNPNKKYRDFHSWAGGVLVIASLSLFAMAYMDNLAITDPTASELYQLLKVVLLSTIIFAGVFAIGFTSPPTTTAMRVLFITAYAFSLTSIFFPLAMIMWVGKGDVQNKMINSPVGIVHACALDLSGSGKSIPEEIRCAERHSRERESGNQWVVQLGGTVQPMAVHQLQLLPTMMAAASAQSIILNAEYLEPEKRRICTRREDNGGELRNCFLYDPHVIQQSDGQYHVARHYLSEDEQGHYWLGVSHENYGDAKFMVYGGIVVPLYVLIIAQLGGIIGLMRRVPELQRQYWEGRQARIDALGETDSRDEAHVGFSIAYKIRGCLIFQILQVISAPLIALVAFHLFSPASTLSSVALAFVCGFASEAILLKIRDLNDSLISVTQGKKEPAETGATEKTP